MKLLLQEDAINSLWEADKLCTEKKEEEGRRKKKKTVSSVVFCDLFRFDKISYTGKNKPVSLLFSLSDLLPFYSRLNTTHGV